MERPECPLATRFEQADPANFRRWSHDAPRMVRRIVIHITDGHAEVQKTVHHFKNPEAEASAHFVVGQEGEIVQMVALGDIAYHAGSANSDSIGIEHCARRPGEWNRQLPEGHIDPGLLPSTAQYAASAALVKWLCERHGIPIGRATIMGHCEADPNTTHRDCPNSIWDWDAYMRLLADPMSMSDQGLPGAIDRSPP